MRALRLEAIDRVVVGDAPDPHPLPGEALVAIRAAALNHRDVWIKKGQYAGVRFPCIPGSDGAGVVTAAGDAAGAAWIGREVVINPAFNWGPSDRAQSPEFSILGLPHDGTLAGLVAVPVVQLEARPAHLSWEEAAALPLAGLTAWRALFERGGLRAGERVLVTGIGGGVALMALQLASAFGAEAWVTSGSQEKIDRAVGLGARGGFLYSREGWAAGALKAGGPFDVIVDSAGGEGFGDLIDLAAPGGRIVFYGATLGNPSGLALRKVFWRQISLLGTTMGSPADWGALQAFVTLHRIRPVVSATFDLEHGADAFALMEKGGQFGKIVVRVG